MEGLPGLLVVPKCLLKSLGGGMDGLVQRGGKIPGVLDTALLFDPPGSFEAWYLLGRLRLLGRWDELDDPGFGGLLDDLAEELPELFLVGLFRFERPSLLGRDFAKLLLAVNPAEILELRLARDEVPDRLVQGGEWQPRLRPIPERILQELGLRE